MTLKDATNEAIRDWCCHPSDTYYIIGSTVGPHPYPDMVARLQSVISEEIKKQLSEQEGRDYPDYLIACVGGGSNAAGTIYHFIDDERVKIVLAEAGGLGITTGQSAATIQLGKKGIIHGARTLVMQNEDGQIESLIPSLPDWTIRVSDRSTPTCQKLTELRFLPSMMTKR